MTNNYITVFGFTLGPIFEVLKSSKKTKEIWFASYFFSWYARKIFEEINIEGNKLLKPVLPEDYEYKPSTAGFFPDHIVGISIKNQDDLYNDLKSINESVFNYFIELIFSIDKINLDRNKISEILNNYLVKEFVVFNSNEANSELIQKTDKILTALELNRKLTISKAKQTCERCQILPSVIEIFIPLDKKRKLCPLCLLKLKAAELTEVQKVTGITANLIKRPFPSTGEISAVAYLTDEIIKKQNENDEIDFDVFKDEKNFFPAYKYVAIIQADGDNLGLLGAVNKSLSSNLFKFSKKAFNKILEYKGQPIYIGGDDILAFTPLLMKSGEVYKTIFELVTELSDIYKKEVNASENGKNDSETMSTLSVGVHLFYYKAPLSLAMGLSGEQLFGIAKKFRGYNTDLDKNALAIQLTQHSGQTTSIVLKFDSLELKFVREIFKEVLTNDKYFSHNIHRTLGKYKTILNECIEPDEILALFSNIFNEEEHKSMSGISVINKLFQDVLIESKSKEEWKEKLENILKILKFVDFIRG